VVVETSLSKVRFHAIDVSRSAIVDFDVETIDFETRMFGI